MGNGYGIFRIKKIKCSDTGELIGTLKHIYRQFDYKNDKTNQNVNYMIDEKNKAQKNSHWEKSFGKFKDLTNDVKKRNNSVGSFEIVFTCSERNDWKKENYIEYLKKCIGWAHRKFNRKNCIAVSIHMDEKIPHVHMIYVPLQEKDILKKQTAAEREQKIQRTEHVKQLNAKQFFDGKKALSDFQTKFYEEVTKNFGFERGESSEKTHRTHQRIRLDEEIAKYGIENAKLKSENSDLQKKIDNLKIENEQLKIEKSDLEKKINDLKIKNEKIVEKNDEKTIEEKKDDFFIDKNGKKIVLHSIIDEFFKLPDEPKKTKHIDRERER